MACTGRAVEVEHALTSQIQEHASCKMSTIKADLSAGVLISPAARAAVKANEAV